MSYADDLKFSSPNQYFIAVALTFPYITAGVGKEGIYPQDA